MVCCDTGFKSRNHSIANSPTWASDSYAHYYESSTFVMKASAQRLSFKCHPWGCLANSFRDDYFSTWGETRALKEKSQAFQ